LNTTWPLAAQHDDNYSFVWCLLTDKTTLGTLIHITEQPRQNKRKTNNNLTKQDNHSRKEIESTLHQI